MKNKKIMTALSISAMLLMVTSASAFAGEVPAAEMIPATETMKAATIEADAGAIDPEKGNTAGKAMTDGLLIELTSLVPNDDGFSFVAKNGVELVQIVLDKALR